MTTTKARVKLSPDQLRVALTDIGLQEEEQPIEGYAFTFFKQPRDAVIFFVETHGGREPTRFYLDRRSFILSD